MTEQMFGRVPLNLVVTAIKDGTHGTHARVDNGIPFLSAKNITDSGEVSWNETDDRISDSEYEQIHRVFQLQPRDLLLTIVGSLGRRAVFDGAKVTFQRSVAYVRPDRRRVSERFLFHWFAHGEFQRELVRRSNSTAQAGLYLGELAQTLVPDCPLTEQIKIAEVLDTLDSTIRQTQAIIDKLKQVKQGLLHDLLTRGIADNGELRPPQSEAPHLYKESALGWIPRTWKVQPLGELAEVARGKFTHRPRNDPAFYGGQYPFIQTGDVARAAGSYVSEYSQTLSERGISVSQEFPAGTIAITIAANIADTAILARPMYFPDSVVGAIVAPTENIRFLELSIRRAKPALDARAPQSAQKNINLQDLRPLMIAVPIKNEQDAIAERYDAVQTRLDSEERAVGKLRTLKSGLMDDLLSGRVRVTLLLLGAPA